MSENSKIEWTDHTFNAWTGCTKVSPGCANCYAEGWSKRSGIVEWGQGKPRRRTSEANWRQPLKWNREAEAAKVRPRVFCASLADWLDDEVPIEWLVDLLDLIRQTPNLDWLLLTKRPELWRPRLDHAHAASGLGMIDAWLDGVAPPNVWIGTTVEDQARAMQRVLRLLEIPATVRFLSCEPLLELVNLPTLSDIDWVIAGGESGHKCRPFDPDWARELRDECQRTGTAFFMKQMGGTRKPFPAIPEDLMIREFPNQKEVQA